MSKKAMLPGTCVARIRRYLSGPNCYSQVEGKMTVDYINNEPVAFSLCPSLPIPKGFEDYYVSERIDNFPFKLFSVFSKALTDYKRNVGLMPRKSFLKNLAIARCIDSERVRG